MRKNKHIKISLLLCLIFLFNSIFMFGMPLTSLAIKKVPLTLMYDNFETKRVHKNMKLNGDASFGHNGELIVTPAGSELWGSIYNKSKITIEKHGAFSCYFVFNISQLNDGGAEGITFFMQPENKNNGGAFGSGLAISGINKSLAVEFDTFDNTTDLKNPINGDPGNVSVPTLGNHIAIDANGDLDNYIARTDSSVLSKPNFKSGQDIHVWIDYNALADGASHNMNIYISYDNARPSNPTLFADMDLSKIIGKKDIFVGFTGTTGTQYQSQIIKSFYFINKFNPITFDGSEEYSPVPTNVAVFKNPDKTGLFSTITASVTKDDDSPAATDTLQNYNISILPDKPLKFKTAPYVYPENPNLHVEHFADKNSISDYALPSVSLVVQAKIMMGSPDNLFKPNAFATRAQVSAALYNTLIYASAQGLSLLSANSYETIDVS